MKLFLSSLFLTLCLSTFGYAQSLDSHEVKMLNISKTEVVPKIDGKLNEATWDKSTVINDFKLTSGAVGTLATQKTECYITYDEENLYIAFKAHDNDIKNIKDNCKEWDDTDILLDDRVEVFIDIGHNHRNYYEFAVNPSGVQFDRSGFTRYRNVRTADWDITWNSFWRARTQIWEDSWTAEIAIDLETLGIEKITSGTTFGFNLGRVRQPSFENKEGRIKIPKENCETSAWIPTTDGVWETLSNFYEPSMFGDLVFDVSDLTISDIRFKSAKFNWGDSFTTSTFGWNPLEIHLESKTPGSNEIIVDLKLESENAPKWESTEKHIFSKDEPVRTQYYIPENKEGKLTVRLLDPKTKEQLYAYTYIITTPPFIEYDLEPLYQRKLDRPKSIGYRLAMDAETVANSALELGLYHHKTKTLVVKEKIENLTISKNFSSFFNTEELRELAGGNYFIESKLIDKKSLRTIGSFTQDFTKFNLELPEKFQAVEGEYSFSGITDHAIRIQYPEGHEFVFWAAANYNPWWDIDQAIVNHEHLETWGGGIVQGCCEVMQDREKKYSRVELIENTPARVIVRWRYALADAHYNIHKNEWGDEYYTFFPDGTGLREINLWANSTKKHEFLEIIPVKPGGVQSLQLYDNPIASMKTLDGQGHSTNVFWKENDEFYTDFVKSAEDFVVEFNLKERRHPYFIFSLGSGLLPGVDANAVNVCSPARSMEKADERGHWPVSLYAIDGYNSIGTDRPRHGNIGSIHASVVDYDNEKNKWVVFIGTEQEGGKNKYLHGKSWLYPADIKVLDKGTVFKGYDPLQRAYTLKVVKSAAIAKFQMTAQSPILNPAFIFDEKLDIKKVTIGNNAIPMDNVKVGYSEKNETVVFIDTKLKNEEIVSFQFE